MAKTFTDHPEFNRVSRLVNEALANVAHTLDCLDALHAFDVQTNRVADDMTKLFLRSWDRDHAAIAKAEGR